MCLLPDVVQMDLAESGVNDKKHLGLESDSLVAHVFKKKSFTRFYLKKTKCLIFLCLK